MDTNLPVTRIADFDKLVAEDVSQRTVSEESKKEKHRFHQKKHKFRKKVKAEMDKLEASSTPPTQQDALNTLMAIQQQSVSKRKEILEFCTR